MSPNVTRRRLIQGVGALGVAGVAGNALVSANDGSGAVQQDGAALRVAHASPDTPSVNVTVQSADDATGTDSDGTNTATAADGDDPLVNGLEFSNVSEYNELDPGTYQVEIVATESTGFLEGFFGDQEERVIYDDEVELEAGTTYTVVAYGKLAEADLGDTSAETDTPGVGAETETDDGGVIGDEADTPTDTDDGGVIGDETETDTPGIGEETETDAGSTGDQVVVESLEYGDHQTFELEAGDYTLEFREASAAGGDTVGAETPTDDGLDEETETETDTGVIGEETETDSGATGSEQPSDRAFDVAVLEDDLSAPGDATTDGAATDAATSGETATDDGAIGQETETDGGVGQETETDSDGSNMTRIRVFHAALDVDALEITAVESDGDGGGIFGDGDGNETETDTETAGAVGGEQEETATAGGETGSDGETGSGGETTVQETGISPEGGTVYSGFAVGYFDPSAAEGTPSDDGTATDAETETDAVGGVGQETETDDGGVGQETETPPTTADGDEIVEDDAAEAFQFVMVEDASDGDRSDGGTDDGGIIPQQSAPEAASD